ncbi:amino acid/amide ABC transporter substrate-binding protein, HAAT family [Desulfatibacillum alkenivorans DSM 16219]|jgi:ABC-type branched-subunit amino acid transport system substrate-binding protein|uniref:Amino acid/amide ABC transporter substrate-binding protein, HAAT family n=1 Tax=Desulfatibacillum alkenivorans DSM 16219 TaxID=1121393 RepID=A0A1M6JYE7_9BACT|nr:ABC transporter substrate-binding protein [Desulfatibacillum alkenivorans]SHJ51729.1 amino acid/amide ABC transporter substrate-binding protein, HAAT family [Desulfatibacillum alkenivorans DSM 16219]
MRTHILLASFALFFLIACMGFPAFAEEGVTDTEIHIGQWGPQTGPAAAWGSVARGTGVLFEMINEKGGIHGRKIIYHTFNDAYNPAQTLAGVKQLQESVGIFAWVGGVGTAPGMAVKDYLMERKVPWISPASGSMHWIDPPQKYLFATYPLYKMEAKALCRYSVEILGKNRIAIAYQNDDYGANGLKGAKEELAKHGLTLVAQVPVDTGEGDLRPHAAKLKQSDADTVLLWVAPKHAIALLGAAKAMKYDPQWMSTSTCSDYPYLYDISKGLWEGVITTFFGDGPDSFGPLMREYKAAYDKFAAPGERWGTFFTAGFGFAEPLVEALHRCGRDLSRERLVEELEKLQYFRGVMGRISFAPFDPDDPMCRQGQTEVFIAKCVEDGDMVQLTDWLKID